MTAVSYDGPRRHMTAVSYDGPRCHMTAVSYDGPRCHMTAIVLIAIAISTIQSVTPYVLGSKLLGLHARNGNN